MIDKITKSRTLFLWLDSHEFHALNAKRRGVPVADVFRKTPKALKALRRIHINLRIGLIHPWLNSTWTDRLNEYDTIIIHASILTPPVVRYINQVKPEIRVIVWYWNPVCKSEPIKSFSSLNCEIWTFDEQDAEKYGLKHNTQYYFNDIDIEKNASEGALFVGGDKGRLSYLLDIEKRLKKVGVNTDFHIVRTSGRDKETYKYQNRISYSETLKKIASNNIIVDIVSDGQHGLTLRPLEALYFNKKLITNDENIINRNFYNKNNIFILGTNNFSDLGSFINSPVNIADANILEYYDFDCWLSRFLIHKRS